MHATGIKLGLSAAILVTAALLAVSVGTTQAEADDVQGMMIDFGYYEVDWVEMTFHEGMDGYDALEAACDIAGYEVRFRDDGTLASVDGQTDLVGITWGMYVPGDDGRWVSADPLGIDASDYRIICFARASGADTAMPGADATGFGYYSYARDGRSLDGGEELRIVSLAPSVTETLCAIGGTGHIIGTDLYSDWPQEILDGRADGSISVVGGYTDPNYEYIVRLSPDIVFCDGSVGEHMTMADRLRKAGIDCVVLYNCTDIDTLYENMWICASALGMSENANSEINSIRHTVNTVSGIAGMTNKRVFSALSADPSPWTAGSYTFMNDIVVSAGGRNVFETQSSSWFMVSKEQIYAKQPQVIIVLSASEVSSEEGYAAVLDSLDPLWKQTPAYRNGDVYVFSGDSADVFQRPGPRMSEAVELLSKILNPEAFTDRDPLDTVPKYFGNDYRDYLTYQPEAVA